MKTHLELSFWTAKAHRLATVDYDRQELEHSLLDLTVNDTHLPNAHADMYALGLPGHVHGPEVGVLAT